MNRTETTAMLSALVEKRLDSRTSYWAREVSFRPGYPQLASYRLCRIQAVYAELCGRAD